MNAKEALEEENKKLKEEVERLKGENDKRREMLRVLQQQNTELIQGMENVKADFEMGGRR